MIIVVAGDASGVVVRSGSSALRHVNHHHHRRHVGNVVAFQSRLPTQRLLRPLRAHGVSAEIESVRSEKIKLDLSLVDQKNIVCGIS